MGEGRGSGRRRARVDILLQGERVDAFAAAIARRGNALYCGNKVTKKLTELVPR